MAYRTGMFLAHYSPDLNIYTLKRLLQFANLATLLFTIWVNYYANTQIGLSMKAISDQYLNLFTPAGYAFSIWGFIYIGLLALALYQLLDIFTPKVNNDFVLKIGGWFIVANLANASWVLAFLHNYITLSVFIMMVLFGSLLRIVLNLNMEKWDAPFVTIAFIWWPISLYFGWVNIAFMANVSAWLTSLGWTGSPLTPTFWAMLMLLVATAILITMIWKRNMREYATAAVWGIVAIGVKNTNSNDIVAYTAYVVAAVVLINTMLHGYKNRAMGPIRRFRPKPPVI